MTEKLPITIDVCDPLIQQFSKIASVCNKLEAQLNFQTMGANWYAEEDNILFVQLKIETLKTYELLKKSYQEYNIKNYSDDVFSCYENTDKVQQLNCYIAITDVETAMLEQQSNVLADLLNIKLNKVINLIAKQLKLNAI